MILSEKFYGIKDNVYVYRYNQGKRIFTEEKVYHLLKGLKDDLIMAVNSNLLMLYELTLNRIKKDYKKAISSASSERIDKIKKEIMDICIQRARTTYRDDKKKTKVSVVLPIYNAAPFLKECLDSVISQTLKEIEIICVNDGSTDNSLNVLKSYSQKDNRIIVINQPNKGVSYTRNKAIGVATGEFIAFMDADDYYPNINVLEILYTAAVQKHVLICGGGGQIYDGTNL